MRILILNGNPDLDNTVFDDYLVNLSLALGQENHEVRVFVLKEMKIRHCIGCFVCWEKTPGICVFKDDARDIHKEYVNSDFVLFASPIIMGFTSSLLKRTLDRLIPIVHPYFEIVDGKKISHVPRYLQYPRIGLLLSKENWTDEEDIEIITNIYERISFNFKSKLLFTNYITTPIEVIVDEIVNN